MYFCKCKTEILKFICWVLLISVVKFRNKNFATKEAADGVCVNVLYRNEKEHLANVWVYRLLQNIFQPSKEIVAKKLCVLGYLN